MDVPGASLCEGDKTGMQDYMQSEQDTDWAEDHQWQLNIFIMYYILLISITG